MTARVIAWGGTFTASNLPKIELTHTPPLPGAAYDWAVDILSPGGVTAWPDLVSGRAMVADGKAPELVADDSGKKLAFDGVSSRMRVSTGDEGPHTIVAVYRFQALAPNHVVHFGLSSRGAGSVGTGGNGATVNASAGGNFIVPSPFVAPDTGWHVAILTVDGARSAFRHDDKEFAGNLTVQRRDGVTLGFAEGATARTPIDYKRIAIIPGSMDSAQRAGLARYLKNLYGI